MGGPLTSLSQGSNIPLRFQYAIGAGAFALQARRDAVVAAVASVVALPLLPELVDLVADCCVGPLGQSVRACMEISIFDVDPSGCQLMDEEKKLCEIAGQRPERGSQQHPSNTLADFIKKKPQKKERHN